MRFGRRLLSGTTLLLSMVAVVGCGGVTETGADGTTTPVPSSTAPTTTMTTPGPVPSPGRPVRAGMLAFAGTTLDGRRFDAASLAGRPVLIWFWAPWCPTCVAEAPDVLDVQRTHHDTLAVLGVAGLDDKANMQPFVDRTKTGGITHLADPEGEIWRRFRVVQQSTYVLVDASGNVTFTGVLGADDLREKVAALAG